MDANIISADFERLKAACAGMNGKKIYVGIVGSADSEVQIGRAHV